MKQTLSRNAGRILFTASIAGEIHRAGMDNTQVGSEGKSESQPDDVAKQGIDALLAGDDHVSAASLKTKMEGMLANATPGVVKGAMHEKMARPKQ